MRSKISPALLSCVLALVIIPITGCATTNGTPPPPINPARPDPPQVQALDELIDEMSQQLAVALPNVPEVRQSPYQYVLAVADFESTGFSQAHRFHQALQSIETRLMGNRAISDAFIVVDANHQSSDAYLAAISGPTTADLENFDDPTGRGATPSRKTQYDPRYLYFMTGRFYQMDEPGGRKSYRLFVDIEKPSAKQRVISREFRVDYVWNREAGRWLTGGQDF
ncbi:MAG: hypothetical protein AAGF84_00220 [Planctomycetota bacterium]